MELRVLRYFVAIVREHNMSRAALQLHVTQPTLSRQITELEEELGTPLLVRARSARGVQPTEAGKLLYDRAVEILSLADRVHAEITEPLASLNGEVWIGGGETQGMQYLADAAAELRNQNPNVRFNIFSGNAEAVTERMDKGLLDFGVLVGEADKGRYEALPIPASDVWGLVMRRDDPLSEHARISREVFLSVPLIVSQQTLDTNELAEWAGQPLDMFNIAATYNLLYNATLLVRAGIGCALAIDGLAGQEFAFRPLDPERRVRLSMVWKRSRILSPAAEAFLALMKGKLQST